MSARCENCGDPVVEAVEDTECADCTTGTGAEKYPPPPPPPGWTGEPSAPWPIVVSPPVPVAEWPPPRPSAGHRCENCGGFMGQPADDGLCSLCGIAERRAVQQRQEMAELTAQAHEAAGYARRHGTWGQPAEDGDGCSSCGRWLSKVEADDFGGICIRCADPDSPR